jgi:hypothetical protein
MTRAARCRGRGACPAVTPPTPLELAGRAGGGHTGDAPAGHATAFFALWWAWANFT